MGPDENATFTRRLSHEIDAAYADYRHDVAQNSERLFKAFRAQASNIASYRLGWDDPFLAGDIAARAFLAIKSFRDESEISTWFYRLAQNEANRALRNRIKNRNREVSLSGDDDGDNPLERLEAQLASPPTCHDLSLDVATLKCGLPHPQAEVLALHDEGYSLEQIAKKLGKPLGTIRGRYRLAKEKMRRKVQK
jgi:RNA polymerase sigma factor (sigma-70 family)